MNMATNTGNKNLAFVPDENSSGKSVITVRIEKKRNDSSKSNDLDNYDPFKHRHVEQPTTIVESFFHFIKCSFGSGILSMPQAFLQAGWLMGLIAVCLIGTVCTYCIYTVIRAQYELCKRRKIAMLGYPGIAREAMADGPLMFQKISIIAPHIVNAFLILYQLGVCCVYFSFIGENTKEVLDIYIGNTPKIYYMLMFLLPIMLMTFLKNLKWLAPVSIVANFIMFTCHGIVVYYLIHQGPTFENRTVITDTKHIALSFGSVLYAIEAIGAMLPIENEMKSPQYFTYILNGGMTFVVLCYGGIGLLGYLSFGDKTSEFITGNLPQDEMLAKVAKILLILSIALTYALQFYAAFVIIWFEYIQPRLLNSKFLRIWEFSIKCVFVLFTFLVAVSVPKIDLFISLVGGLCISALGLVFPATIDLSTWWRSFKGYAFVALFIKNVIIITFGLFVLFICSYTSIMQIIECVG